MDDLRSNENEAVFDQSCGDLHERIIIGLGGREILFYFPYFLIVFGILGNLLNILVYSHKCMSNSPISTILKSQAICDFLLLTSYFFIRFLQRFRQSRDTFVDLSFIITPIIIRGLRLVAIWLHIVLAHRRYGAVAQFLRHEDAASSQSTKMAIIVILVCCFFERFLTAIVISIGIDADLIRSTFVGLLCFKIPTFLSLTVLAVVTIRLIYVMVRAHIGRQDLLDATDGKTDRMKDINRIVLLVLLVFFVSEMPPLLQLFTETNIIYSHLHFQCLVLLEYFNIFLYLNPSINTVCYLMNTQYREVLKLLFRYKRDKLLIAHSATAESKC